jgi:hypothetical protein
MHIDPPSDMSPLKGSGSGSGLHIAFSLHCMWTLYGWNVEAYGMVELKGTFHPHRFNQKLIAEHVAHGSTLL